MKPPYSLRLVSLSSGSPSPRSFVVGLKASSGLSGFVGEAGLRHLAEEELGRSGIEVLSLRWSVHDSPRIVIKIQSPLTPQLTEDSVRKFAANVSWGAQVDSSSSPQDTVKLIESWAVIDPDSRVARRVCLRQEEYARQLRGPCPPLITLGFESELKDRIKLACAKAGALRRCFSKMLQGH